MRKASFVTVGTFSAVFAVSPVIAADPNEMAVPPGPAGLPAVSGVNWKLGVAGGFADIENEALDGRVHGEASVSVPLTFSTGFQLDGSVGDLGGSTTASIGGHLFTRDPASHLFGLWGGYAAIGSNDIARIGPEAEFYLGNFTVQGTVGFEDSDLNGDDFYTFANLAVYPVEDVQLYVGYRRSLGRDVGAAGLEWLIGGPMLFDAPMSVFAEGQMGADDHATVWAGLRFYFGGPDKSLMRRHREDDPTDPSSALNQLAGQCINYVALDAVLEDGCTEISLVD